MGSHHHDEPLRAALLLTALFAAVEAAGGLWAHSLALLADAGHMVSDIGALTLAVVARRIARRPAHDRMTFGYGRARVLAAQANGVGLWFLCGWIAWEAVGRLTQPPEVHGPAVLVIALIGLAVNLVILRWLHGEHDINSRAAYWHVLGDALGSVAAVAAGGIILATGWMLADPLLSFVVVAILGWGGWRLVRETTRELMAGVPPGIDAVEISRAMRAHDNVCDVHHLHIWRLPDGRLGLSAHVSLAGMDHWPKTWEELSGILAGFGVEHATLQPEPEGPCPDGRCCRLN